MDPNNFSDETRSQPQQPAPREAVATAQAHLSEERLGLNFSASGATTSSSGSPPRDHSRVEGRTYQEATLSPGSDRRPNADRFGTGGTPSGFPRDAGGPTGTLGATPRGDMAIGEWPTLQETTWRQTASPNAYPSNQMQHPRSGSSGTQRQQRESGGPVSLGTSSATAYAESYHRTVEPGSREVGLTSSNNSVIGQRRPREANYAGEGRPTTERTDGGMREMSHGNPPMGKVPRTEVGGSYDFDGEQSQSTETTQFDRATDRFQELSGTIGTTYGGGQGERTSRTITDLEFNNNNNNNNNIHSSGNSVVTETREATTWKILTYDAYRNWRSSMQGLQSHPRFHIDFSILSQLEGAWDGLRNNYSLTVNYEDFLNCNLPRNRWWEVLDVAVKGICGKTYANETCPQIAWTSSAEHGWNVPNLLDWARQIKEYAGAFKAHPSATSSAFLNNVLEQAQRISIALAAYIYIGAVQHLSLSIPQLAEKICITLQQVNFASMHDPTRARAFGSSQLFPFKGKREELLSKERYASPKKQSQPPTATLTETSPNRSRREEVKCNFCHKTGHVEEDCRKKRGHDSNKFKTKSATESTTSSHK